jgi:hypothetical protein
LLFSFQRPNLLGLSATSDELFFYLSAISGSTRLRVRPTVAVEATGDIRIWLSGVKQI